MPNTTLNELTFSPLCSDNIQGENDRALGKELTLGMEKYFSSSFEIKYITNCSHWVQNEYPELVNKYLVDFFEAEDKA